MENLARGSDANDNVRKDVERKVLSELERCRIPTLKHDAGRSEVPYGHIGKLGNFTFRRAWYYWVVDGPVPLAIAEELYADHIGKTDIRVGGHCGCPSPAEYGTEYFDAEGKQLYESKGKEKDAEEMAAMDKYVPNWRDEYRVVEDRDAECVRAIVSTYHIDTELGLYIFVETLRKHGVVPE